MMASHYHPHFPSPRFSLCLLALGLFFTVTESAAPIQLTGEVGGKVTFDCPVDKERKVQFLYLQRGVFFINGYHASKNIKQSPWNNTRVDGETTIHMYNLTISHDGDYQCHIRYSDEVNDDVDDTTIHLSVTANYSTPALTVHCRDENHHFGCRVTCASYGGYPGSEVKWNVSGTQMWKVVNSSEMSDRHTKMVNSSSTAYFNCSNGAPTFLSCSVGGVPSHMMPVCDRGKPDPPGILHPYVIVAICAVVIISIGVWALVWYKRKKRRTGVTVNVRHEVIGHEDVHFLQGVNEIKQ